MPKPAPIKVGDQQGELVVVELMPERNPPKLWAVCSCGKKVLRSYSSWYGAKTHNSRSACKKCVNKFMKRGQRSPFERRPAGASHLSTDVTHPKERADG